MNTELHISTDNSAERSADRGLLLALLDIEERARCAASLKELAFLIANETHLFVPFRQAILVDQAGEIMALSGVATIDSDAPFLQWLRRNILNRAQETEQFLEIVVSDLPEKEAAQWENWLPPFLCVYPITSPNGTRYGALIIARREPIENEAHVILDRLLQCYGHAWSVLSGPKCRNRFLRKPIFMGLGLVAIFAALGFVQLEMSVLAPAEIVPLDPAVMRAPLEGVVDRIIVRPNQKVSAGDLLFQMDSDEIAGELAVSKKALDTLVIQYRQVSRKAVGDRKSKAQLPIIAGQAEEQEAAIQRLQDLIERTNVRAETNGTVIFDSAMDWLGRPVRIGERVLMIADERQIEIEAWLPISDAIQLAPGAQVKLFLNSDPLNPLRATVRLYSYEAQPRPDGVLAHRIRATLRAQQDVVRIGLRGTARFMGEKVSLAYWIFRKPISEIRQFLGM